MRDYGSDILSDSQEAVNKAGHLKTHYFIFDLHLTSSTVYIILSFCQASALIPR